MKFRIVLVLLTVFSLGACTTPRQSAKNSDDIKVDEVVLVGAVFLEPKLKDAESQVRGGARNQVFIKFDDHQTPMLEQLNYMELKNIMMEEWGKTFYIPVPRSEKI